MTDKTTKDDKDPEVELGPVAPAAAEAPAEAIAPQVAPEAASETRKRYKKSETRTLTYSGPADVFSHTTEDGEVLKFRPGVATVISANEADELLTYPGHTFAETADAEEDQEQNDGNT